MPIKFRCRHCRQFLGISRAQAGEITDCPMCGKSIRVPNLDGSIAPIPSPELDLKDAELVDALSQLAEIGKSSSSAEATALPHVSATHDATVISPTSAPAPKAAPLPSPAPRIAEDSDTVIQAGGEVGTVVDKDDPLRELAESSPVLPPTSSPFQRVRGRRSAWITAVAATLAIGIVILLWMNGGSDLKPSALEAASGDSLAATALDEAPESSTVDSRSVASPVDQPATDGEPAVTGRVTYESESGDTRPDSGARILLLPRPKPGTVKLDVAGFLAGADHVDADVARAAIQAMGGDLATAGEDGNYQLDVSAAGDYQLIAISRHQSRDSSTPIDTRLQETLFAYFFRPATLLGSLAFRADEFDFRGQGTSSRDFLFADE